MALLAPLAQAGTLTLTWDAPQTNQDGSPLTDLAGFKIYYGAHSKDYTAAVDVGNVTTYTLTGLTEGLRHYFVARAYDARRNESLPSNEVSAIPRPEASLCAADPGAYVQTSLPVVPVAARLALYSDQTTPRLTTVPALLDGGCLVQTRAADRNSTASRLVTLALQRDATVYVGYDERYGLPRWLRDHYTRTGVRLQLSTSSPRMILWAIPVSAGQALSIPGTRYQRKKTGGLAYTVLIQGETP